MRSKFMSRVSQTAMPRAALYSRLEWYSRLAETAPAVDRVILDARCHLLVKTIMRRTAFAHSGGR